MPGPRAKKAHDLNKIEREFFGFIDLIGQRSSARETAQKIQRARAFCKD